MKRFFRDRRGSEMLEFAVTAPLVLVLVLGLFQVGMVAYASQMAKEASRHGARTGSVAMDRPAERAHAAAMEHAESAFALGSPRVLILAPGGVTGTELRVRVVYTVPNLFARLGSLVPGLPSGPFEVFGEATARQEGW
jgi:hypothetical protein